MWQRFSAPQAEVGLGMENKLVRYPSRYQCLEVRVSCKIWLRMHFPCVKTYLVAWLCRIAAKRGQIQDVFVAKIGHAFALNAKMIRGRFAGGVTGCPQIAMVRLCKTNHSKNVWIGRIKQCRAYTKREAYVAWTILTCPSHSSTDGQITSDEVQSTHIHWCGGQQSNG